MIYRAGQLGNDGPLSKWDALAWDGAARKSLIRDGAVGWDLQCSEYLVIWMDG